MFNVTVELFLTEYFVIMASVGKFVKDPKDLFLQISKTFLIPDEAVNGLYALTNSDAVREIAVEQDYLRYQRLQKYSALSGDKDETNVKQQDIIRIKGGALSIAARQKLGTKPDASRNSTFINLITAANDGSVTALKIIGFLQCEGVFFDKNLKSGIKNFSKTANWNDCVGSLALLHYSSSDRFYNMSRLRMTSHGTPYESLYVAASKAYGIGGESNVAEVKLLNKAFTSALLKRDVYNPTFARILYSEVLSALDKEKAMFTVESSKLSVLGDLPLKLSKSRARAFNVSVVDGVALKRQNEYRKIVRALCNADLRTLNEYRPLCVSSASPYLLNMYAREISSEKEGINVEKIDVADLCSYDLEPTLNNIFVRNIDEDKDNRFLLFFVGNVSDKIMEFVKNFLQSSRRAKFRLNNPNVTINLSAALPICFCDKRNARLLQSYCDVVQLADVTADEIESAATDIINGKSALYGVDMTLDGKARDIFDGYGIDVAEKVIDAIARDHRRDGEKVVISRAIVAEYALENSQNRIGFGA